MSEVIVVPPKEANEFARRIFSGDLPVSEPLTGEVLLASESPYIITGYCRINPVARAVRAALNYWS